MPTPSLAAGTYANIARLADPAGASGQSLAANNLARLVDPSAAGESFGAMLKDVLNTVTEAGKKTDTQTKSLIAGKSDMIDVVTAISDTEVAVQTMVAVRDKVIEAYQNVMAMPI